MAVHGLALFAGADLGEVRAGGSTVAMGQTQMDTKDYDHQLATLRESLLLMAGRVEGMIAAAIRAVVQRDVKLARETIDADHRVNAAELEIDEQCLAILDGRHPEGTDLRFVTLALKMVTDLERIGDLAVNICERAIDLTTQPELRPMDDIFEMGQAAHVMVRDAIDAFVASDVKKAEGVIASDDRVDELYHQVFREVLEQMRTQPETIERGIHVQSIAKWLERMGDHATNLAELVVFMVKGKDIRHVGKL